MAHLPTGAVTFLYTDLEGSTALWERHPRAMRGAVARHAVLLCQAIDRHGGHVFRNTGDGLCAAFAIAPDAVAAALAAQRALVTEPWDEQVRPRARLAIHTGTVERQAGDYVGACLNRVARLMAVAHGGQVLLSQATADLARDALPTGGSLRDLGEHGLRDLIHPDLPTDFPLPRSLHAYPHTLPLQPICFVGRDREMVEARRLASARLWGYSSPPENTQTSTAAHCRRARRLAGRSRRAHGLRIRR